MRTRAKPVDPLVAANRRTNLKAIIANRGGNQKVGDVVGWTAGFVSHLRTGCAPFTDRSARRIEASFELPQSWLDQIHDDGGIPFGYTSKNTPVSTAAVLRAIADVATEQNLEPPLDRLSAIAILVAEDAAANRGQIDLIRIRALIALSNLSHL